MSQTLEDQRKMEQLELKKQRILEMMREAQNCPYDPNSGNEQLDPAKIEQARREELRRRQAEILAKKTADQILPQGGLVRINGRLFKVKAANPKEVRLRILPAGK